MSETTLPHIVVFLTDDHGQWAMGCNDNPAIHTPSMDHIARTGVNVREGYTPCPVCSPGRASFFTGTIPSWHGIHDWISEQNEPMKNHPALDGQKTVGEFLQAAGYQTALVGKWHCGKSYLPKPGFDHWFSYGRGQHPHFGRQTFSDNGTIVHREGYQSQLLAEEAIRTIRRRKPGAPLFLFVGLVNTHTPHRMMPERLVAKYRDHDFAEIPDETFSPVHGNTKIPKPEDPAERHEWNAQYYASVEHMDEAVGAIMDELDGQGMTDDTLLIYTGDHGHMNGHHGLWTKGNATTPANLIDESVKIPMVMRWPHGGFESGQVRDEPATLCDVFTTVLDAAGATADDDAPRPGRSLLPLLRGEDAAWPDAVFSEYGDCRMIRSSRYKYIRRYKLEGVPCLGDQLFDLQEDPRERDNLLASGDRPAIADELRDRLESWFAQYEHPERTGRRVDKLPKASIKQPWDIARMEAESPHN